MSFNLHKILALVCVITLIVSAYAMPSYYYGLVHLLFFGVLTFQAVTIYRQRGRITPFAYIAASLAILHTPLVAIAPGKQWWMLITMLVAGFIAWGAGRVIDDPPSTGQSDHG